MLKNIMNSARIVVPGLLLMLITPENSNAKKPVETPVFNYKDSSGKTKDSIAFGSVANCNEDLAFALQGPRIELNGTASTYVKQFIKKNREGLSEVEKRKQKYFSIIEPIFEAYGIPVELKYLAVVESKLKTNALSRVGAKGLWQFMPGTARELGLKVKGKYDERTHAYKSTVAAAKYLKELYRQFGDWLLVIAAYNSGPGYVYKAIKRSGSRNFWKIQSLLPAETRAHVKHFIGTHSFFQEENSVTQLTKQEVQVFERKMEKFHLQQSLNVNEAAVAQAAPVKDATERTEK